MILFKLRKGDPSDSQADVNTSLTRDDDLPKLTHSSPTLMIVYAMILLPLG